MRLSLAPNRMMRLRNRVEHQVTETCDGALPLGIAACGSPRKVADHNFVS
jgi:hypothetical protein